MSVGRQEASQAAMLTAGCQEAPACQVEAERFWSARVQFSAVLQTVLAAALLKPSLAGNDGDIRPGGAAVARSRANVRAGVPRRHFRGGEPRAAGDRAGAAGNHRLADLVVANCESPVVERSPSPMATRLGVRHAMTPAFLDGTIAGCRDRSREARAVARPTIMCSIRASMASRKPWRRSPSGASGRWARRRTGWCGASRRGR